ncbi:MAG TPA: 4a-hydroxytetrahydrobiopterin dehydratase, partial [Actinomycetota bacterium]|nr:4a-hydroxytetrahydrobiopterin dehydratase [Actinomycetota bacterium]
MTTAPEPLAKDEVDRRLADLPGWRREGGEIFKWFRFGSFPEAIGFIDRLVEPCERLNHHPDLENHFDRVRIGLHTWSVNAITEKDLALAAEIERLAGSA